MRLLWIATKSPWPPVDGGRVLLLESIRALNEAGAEVTLVAPAVARSGDPAAGAPAVCDFRPVPVRPRSTARVLARTLQRGGSWSVSRHRQPAVSRAVDDLLAERDFDVVVAEQLQAVAQTAPAARRRLPILLRAQNVESDLWRQAAARSSGPRRRLLLWQAKQLARDEARALAAVTRTVALSAEDAEKLRILAPAARIEPIPPPFPGELEAGSGTLAGDPAVVLFGSAGWEPNREAETRFVAATWPEVRRRLPRALLHRFGGGSGSVAGVVTHPAPDESRDAFAAEAILVLPLAIASGVRMRLLEAWSRGIPVVATPAAASGLEGRDGEELLLARDAEEMADAVARLAADRELRERIVARGRLLLARSHAPRTFAARWLDLCTRVAGGEVGPR
ncbi:MAG: glycosyltransferase family 4 protein [Thermoanaerobaculia bacterium]